jgi:hypothetical protein
MAGFYKRASRDDSEKDNGVLIDGTVHRERTMASFWSKVWAGRAFFFVRSPPVVERTVIAQQQEVYS